MLPVIALLGRPNVGKSTLFNYLTCTRDALVANYPGLTRDRQYGYGKRGSVPYLVVDTGGITGDGEGIDGQIADQAMKAIGEADAVIFLVDGRVGLHPGDEAIALQLRKLDIPIYLAANKLEGQSEEQAFEFYALGLDEPHAISAERGDRVVGLVDYILGSIPSSEQEEQDMAPGIRVAMIGRPNVGKSTLINRILGEDRLVTADMPGTTRDSIFVPFERNDKQYTMIDTAGVRRRARIDEAIEKFSVIKTMQAIDRAHVCVIVLDASQGIAEQDARLIGLAMERGRSLVIGVNKWDLMTEEERETFWEHYHYKLPFLDFAKVHNISALRGRGLTALFNSIEQAYESGQREMPTSELNQLLEQAIMRHQPPAVRGRRVKLRFAHQSGTNPPVITIHGNQTQSVPDHYQRYLVNFFRKAYKLTGAALRIEFKTGDNPFAGRKNQLTERQQKKRRRLVKHVKKNGRK